MFFIVYNFNILLKKRLRNSKLHRMLSTIGFVSAFVYIFNMLNLIIKLRNRIDISHIFFFCSCLATPLYSSVSPMAT